MGARVIKFYSGVITKNIPLFIAAGLLSILFSEGGILFSNSISALVSMIYLAAIPLAMGYTAGRKAGGDMGAIAGLLAASGMVVYASHAAIIGAVLMGGLAGFAVKRIGNALDARTPKGFEMLGQNLLTAFIGGCAAAISCYMLSPLLTSASQQAVAVLNAAANRGLLPLANLLIEPAKIVFLNNWVNYGVLVPLGLEQLQEAGHSCLFLMETNPGPGLGVIAACYAYHKEERRRLAQEMLIQLAGGIHEIYFPYVLGNLRLLWAVAAGGAAGTACFWATGAGLVGPPSPGSIITILMLSRTSGWQGIFLGIFVSAVVSFGVSSLVLGRRDRQSPQSAGKPDEGKERPVMMSVKKIYFVCDAGLGSSAMGAALLRRALREAGCSEIQVGHVPIDEIPSDADLLICQKNYYAAISGLRGARPVYQMENLVDVQAYGPLIESIKRCADAP